MSTKIRLYWRTSTDSRLQPQGVFVRVVRLYAHIGLREQHGWSRPIEAIVDTGSPLTLLPRKIWQTIQVAEFLSDAVPLQGVGKGTLSARLANVELAFLSTRSDIVELRVKAYLADDDSVPLLLGVEDLLTRARMTCDYPKGKAFLQIST